MTARNGNRALIRDYLAANGPQTLLQLVIALHIDSHTISGALSHGCDADVFLRIDVGRGKRYGLVEPVKLVEAQRAASLRRGDSGIIAPITYRQQLARQILAQHELDRQAVAGPRKPGRGRPVGAKRGGVL